MSVLRDAMRTEAGRVWREKESAEKLSLFLNEETITETLLLRLAAKFQGKGLHVQPFTKAQEKRNGADWEFWFAEGTRAVGLRVQAKRLFPSGAYQSLDPLGQQLDNLIRQSGDCFPVYVFYNNPRSYRDFNNGCDCSAYHGPSYFGCTLAAASAVSNTASSDAHILASVSIPWHCLLCESGRPAGQSLPEAVAWSLNDLVHKGKIATPTIEVGLLPELFHVWARTRHEYREITGSSMDEVYEQPFGLAEYLEGHNLAGLVLFGAEGS